MLSAKHKAQRKGRATSSNIAGLIGMHPYQTPRQSVADINGLVEFGGNKYTERGEYLEAPILIWGENWTGLRYEKAEFRTIGEWAGDSADGTYWDGNKLVAVVEAKTVNGRSMDEWGEEETDEVPHHHKIQIAHHFAHWPEVDTCYVPVLGGYDITFKMYIVHRDERLIDMMQRLGKEAWEKYILHGEIPPAMPGDEGDIRAAYPKDDGDIVTDDPLITRLVHEWQSVETRLAEVKPYEDRKKMIRVQLMEAIGERSGAEGLDYAVSFKANKNGSRALRVRAK